MSDYRNTETYVFHTRLSVVSRSQLNFLNEADRLYAEQRKNTRRFQTFVAGRALLAKALRKLVGSEAYQLSYSQSGKPRLVVPKDWCFNITHSDDCIFLAIQKNAEIGIDSEIIKPRNFARVAKKMFADEVYQSIITSKQPLNQFYKFWTQHEAQVKQLGLSVFSTVPANYSPCLSSYQFENCIFSICSQRPIGELLFFYNDKQQENFYLL